MVQNLKTIKIGIVAGEASGDQLGSHLVASIKKKMPNVEFVGIGGPKMIAAGVRSLFPMERLAVRGYVEALRSLPAILRIRRQLKAFFLETPPDLFIGIDAPDFNLSLEADLKKSGIPAFHYVSPSIWAWRGKRIHKIRKSVSKMLVVFPFEKTIYENAGIPVDYVGYPLADVMPDTPDRAAAREQLRISPKATVLALLPGSRQSELHYMAELFIQTAKRLYQQNPSLIFLVPLISRETRSMFEEALHRLKATELPFKVLFGHGHDAMVAADVVLAASGTATLEAALLKRPMVITYRMSPLTWRMMEPRRYLPYAGLPNILAGRFIVPELLQDDATPENLAQAVSNLLSDSKVQSAMVEEFQRIHKSLRQNNGERVSEAVESFIQQRQPA
jgi:lipid-A-disaccharide synthase